LQKRSKDLQKFENVHAPLPSLKALPKLSESKSRNPFPSDEILSISSLAKDIKENREKIIQEISKELEDKTVLPLASLAPSGPLASSLPSAPISKKSPKSSKSALEISQEGVKTALNIEPSARFQPTYTDIKIPETLVTISSKANLPSKPSPDRTPKIRIPKIGNSAVKPSPKKNIIPKYTEGIALPNTSTVIPMIPITSPSVKTVKQVSAASTPSSEVLENIKKIDINKLKSERVVKKGADSGYNVSELKMLAGSLNLTKSGNKKDLIERIKNAILKINPNAFD